eukprot:524879-Pelagomonas_calceolata.AAC.12
MAAAAAVAAAAPVLGPRQSCGGPAADQQPCRQKPADQGLRSTLPGQHTPCRGEYRNFATKPCILPAPPL